LCISNTQQAAAMLFITGSCFDCWMLSPQTEVSCYVQLCGVLLQGNCSPLCRLLMCSSQVLLCLHTVLLNGSNHITQLASIFKVCQGI